MPERINRPLGLTNDAMRFANRIRTGPNTFAATKSAGAISGLPGIMPERSPRKNGMDTLFAAAVSEYQEWQDNKIGRAFNPDKLIAMLYQAGATRAVIGSGSSFNGGTAEYTEIAESARCSGTISLAVMT